MKIYFPRKYLAGHTGELWGQWGLGFCFRHVTLLRGYEILIICACRPIGYVCELKYLAYKYSEDYGDI